MAAETGALVVVNDRADVARLAGARGVHVGQDDLTPSAVRQVGGAGTVIGWSTHSAEQIQRALAAPVDYVAIGPVFGTRTKSTGYSGLGLETFSGLARQAGSTGKPVVAIGGITLATAAAVRDAGAASVAVITDLLATGNPRSRVADYIGELGD
jgi:thiamine-phosphate pyrophosphorylase